MIKYRIEFDIGVVIIYRCKNSDMARDFAIKQSLGKYIIK